MNSHSHLTTSLLSGFVTNAVAASSTTNSARSVAEIFSTRVTAHVSDSSNSKRRRLLQKYKKRKERVNANDSENTSDVGILANKSSRRLQQDEYEYYCPRDTCPTELCDCADAGGSIEDCTTELQAVCKAGKLGDCIFEDYIQVYQEVYCPFVSCVDGGFLESQCDCAFYELYCDRLMSDECSEGVTGISSTDPDKTLFFGCDADQVANVCDQAKECKERGDLNGLDLGTWQGSVMTGDWESSGSRNKFGGGGGGRRIMSGVSLLSMLWVVTYVFF